MNFNEPRFDRLIRASHLAFVRKCQEGLHSDNYYSSKVNTSNTLTLLKAAEANT